MTLKEEIQARITEIFASKWETRAGNVVPDDSSVGLGNDGVELEGTVLYADLSSSTALVDSKAAGFAAKVYKTYLFSAAKIIRAHDGEVTAYDGDRVMAVYIGDRKNTNAVTSALKINAAVQQIINPAIEKQYGSGIYTVKQVVGVDTSKLLVAKTGIRGANDLVWVGRAANYAAKLCSLNNFPTYITQDVYKKINDEAKYSKGVDMWEQRTWTPMNNMTIYGSTYYWNL